MLAVRHPVIAGVPQSRAVERVRAQLQAVQSAVLEAVGYAARGGVGLVVIEVDEVILDVGYIRGIEVELAGADLLALRLCIGEIAIDRQPMRGVA